MKNLLIFFLLFLAACSIIGGFFYFSITKEIRVGDLGEFKEENLVPDFSKKQKVGNITVVELEGTPYEIGYQNGALMKGEIRELLNEAYAQYLPRGSSKSHLIRVFLLWMIKRVDPHIPLEYRQEMQGVADGAGMGYNDILLLNAFEEGLNTLHPLVLLKLFDLAGLSHGCSSVIVHKGSKSDHLIVGQTVDFSITVGAGRSVLYVIKSPHKKTLYTPSFPGFVLLVNGMNEDGLVLTQRATPTGWGRVGTPISAIARKLLEESESLDSARDYLAKSQWFVPRSLLIADFKSNVSSIFEILPGEGVEEIANEKGYSGAANHFKTQEFYEVQVEALNKYGNQEYISRYNGSLRREEYLADYIEAEMSANPEKIAEAISDYNYDRREELQGAERHYNLHSSWIGGTVSNEETSQAIVFVPEEKIIYLADGLAAPVTQGGFVKIDLNF